MGMRQSFGLLQPHMIRDIGITAADFSLAVALQNIVWGATQPIVGMWADKYGTRPVAMLGVLVYIIGLIFLRFLLLWQYFIFQNFFNFLLIKLFLNRSFYSFY